MNRIRDNKSESRSTDDLDEYHSKNHSKLLNNLSNNAYVSELFPEYGKPNISDFKQYYNDTCLALQTNGYPITPWKKLNEIKKCLPDGHNMPLYLNDMVQSHMLTRISYQIPNENEYLKQLISGYDQDSYAALYLLVHHCTDLLDKYRSGFGSQYKNQHHIAYAASLQTKLKIEKFRTKVKYSAEISLEMLNQANKSGYKQNPNQPLHYCYHISTLVDELENSTEK